MPEHTSPDLLEAAEDLSLKVEALLDYLCKLMVDGGLDIERVPNNHIARSTARALIELKAAIAKARGVNNA